MSDVQLPILIAGAILLLLFLNRAKLPALRRQRQGQGRGDPYWWVIPLCFLAGVGVMYLILSS